MLLLQTTNGKCHTAYRFVSFPMTLENIHLLQCTSNALPTNICAIFLMVSTDTRGPWAELRLLLTRSSAIAD